MDPVNPLPHPPWNWGPSSYKGLHPVFHLGGPCRAVGGWWGMGATSGSSQLWDPPPIGSSLPLNSSGHLPSLRLY